MVPGDIPSYDPAEIRANNLSRAEALLMTHELHLRYPKAKDK